LKIGTTEIVDTFAEGFTMWYARLIITAIDQFWLDAGLREFCGFATSVIGCNAEAGIEQYLPPDETVDGRVGAAALVFGFTSDSLGKALVDRVGQCLMTCPTTAVFDGIGNGDAVVPLGKHLRFFGDGFQKSKLLDERRFWRIPVMDGEFVVEQQVAVRKGVAGGNFLIQSADQPGGLAAARRAVDAMASLPGVIAPFPGGVVRSGSKVGSRYKGLVASTADEYCPMLRGRTESKVNSDANCVYEIVLDGTDYETVGDAIAVGIRAACGSEVIAISAGNYGGKLGKHHFHLHELLSR
jgi:formylmethanofuran--tetrahydromethanopterin N-formyltransferase